MKTKKVGIVIDGWKLAIFKKGLDEAGYNYIVRGKEGDALICIQVICPENEVFTKLKDLVGKMNKTAGH